MMVQNINQLAGIIEMRTVEVIMFFLQVATKLGLRLMLASPMISTCHKNGVKKMKYTPILVIAAVLAGLAAPALADQPNGAVTGFTFKTNGTYDQSNLVGQYSSRITQNGQFVGGNHGVTSDQTTAPRSRSEAVQSLLGH
jgi:hypothetical protein